MMEAYTFVTIDRWGKCRDSTVPLKTGNDGTTAGLPQALAHIIPHSFTHDCPHTLTQIISPSPTQILHSFTLIICHSPNYIIPQSLPKLYPILTRPAFLNKVMLVLQSMHFHT